MKKILIPIMLIFSFILFSCGGGGGGAAGASIPDSEYTTHNPHGWGGGSGSGSGGNGGSNNGTIMGGTPLTVTGYTYNGQTYTSVEELRNTIAENAPEGQFTIPFTCTVAGGGSETRTARITKTVSGNDTEILIEHQYKATFPDGAGTQEVSYYMNDGIVLPGDPAGTNINDFIFETNWNIGGTLYPCGSSISVASSGDMDFSTATTEMAPYGFKEEVQGSGEYILGFSSTASGDITINTDKVIKQIDLTSNNPINLDLSGVTFNTNTLNSFSFVGTGTNLTGITLPSGLTSIGNDTFATGYSSLETVVIPNSVTSIGERAFKNCDALENLTLGTGVQTLGEEVFSGCSSLESFTMPNSVQTLGERAFWGCSSLESLTLSNNLQSIPEYAFYACSDLGPDLNIPASVTEIGGTAFWHCEGIQNLTLNSGLQTIGGNAFEACTGLEEVVIPNGVTTIGDNAFLTCSNLTEVSIPPSVSTIGDRAFFGVGAGCELNINSNGGEIALGTLALPNSNFKVNLTGSSIPMQAGGTASIFDSNIHLTEVTLADSVSAIPANAFNGCSDLAEITISSNIDSIGAGAFNGTASGITITFESNQNISPCDLPSSAFNVVLLSGIPTNNGDTIFENAQTLQSVVFKGGQLGVNMAFSGCDNLTTVTFNSYPSVILLNIFPDDVAGIIFDPYPNDMNNVANVGNLLTPNRNFLTNPLAVTFKNNSTTRIEIDENAFNFADAENITYNFEAAPDHNMVYKDGNCFKSGTRIEYGGSYYDWDPTSKSWVQE